MADPDEEKDDASEELIELTPELALENLYLASREYPCTADSRDLLEMSHVVLADLLLAIQVKQAHDEDCWR
jgi:hypothetical protein